LNAVADVDHANGEPEDDHDVIEKRDGHSLDKRVLGPFQSDSFLSIHYTQFWAKPVLACRRIAA